VTGNSSDLHRDVAIGAQKRDAAMFSPKQASLSCASEVFCELGGWQRSDISERDHRSAALPRTPPPVLSLESAEDRNFHPVQAIP
jgi:hypothetical protein